CIPCAAHEPCDLLGLHGQDSAVPPREMSDRNDVSVLVVDDDVDTREMVEQLLTAANYSVVTASDGREALELLETIRPALILLDVQMPVMDGAEFRQQQRRDPALLRIPTVVISGAASE